MSNNSNMLDNWLAKTLCDNPNIIRDNNDPAMIYSDLYEIWFPECQEALKKLIMKSGVSIKQNVKEEVEK